MRLNKVKATSSKWFFVVYLKWWNNSDFFHDQKKKIWIPHYGCRKIPQSAFWFNIVLIQKTSLESCCIYNDTWWGEGESSYVWKVNSSDLISSIGSLNWPTLVRSDLMISTQTPEDIFFPWPSIVTKWWVLYSWWNSDILEVLPSLRVQQGSVVMHLGRLSSKTFFFW